ncbi:hypothetical protein CW357_11305 [Rummeliibacillus sp. TYF005]|nr:hypothetical protein D1606_06640 [Rummeliibacillus sp. POC4]RPJ95193.1 hypothetical protein CW357_11305 [Rummeliibacillus sp. TYF005]
MLIIKILFSALILIAATYSLITKDYTYTPISSLLLGIYFAVLAFEEYKTKGKNGWGLFYLLVSVLIIVMALFSFF